MCVCVWSSYLRDDGDARSEVVQSDLGNVHSVYVDLSLRRLEDPEDPERERRLSGSGPTHDPDLSDRGETQPG